MLDKFDKSTNPFKMPENYFADFNANIMDKLPQKEIKVAKKVPLWERLLPWTAVAAIFLGVVISVGVFDKDISPLGNKSIKSATNSSSVVSSTEEEDFYLYLQEEAVSSMYNEALYSEN